MKTDLQRNADTDIDNLEKMMLSDGELIEFPLKHTFVEGLYIREIFMPTDSFLTSRIHNTEHPFMVLEGRARVYSSLVGFEIVEVSRKSCLI